MKGQIRTSSVVLVAVIALLAGALIATMTGTHGIPVLVSPVHAAALDQMPFSSFAPVVKRTMPAVVNISSSKMVKEQQQNGNMFDDPFSVSSSAAACRNSSNGPTPSAKPVWVRVLL